MFNKTKLNKILMVDVFLQYVFQLILQDKFNSCLTKSKLMQCRLLCKLICAAENKFASALELQISLQAI